MRVAWITVTAFLCVLIFVTPVFSQIDEVRAAIAQKDDLGALRLLSGISDDAATPDTYLYRGIAYANLGEFKRALDAFRAGATRYPGDPRFHNEGLAFYRRDGEIVRAKARLRDVLLANPDDLYASTLLASLDLSDGSIEPALRAMNRRGQPRIARILDNYALTFSSSIRSSALAFRGGEMLNYSDWKTTAARLQATRAFSSVALEIEPSFEPDKYNANVRTTRKANTITGLMVGLLKGVPASTTYLDVWNIGGSWAQFNSSYRWTASRRRFDGKLSFPLPVFRTLFVELGTLQRSELWDVPSQDEFRYKASALRVNVKHIPSHRVELGAGVEYQNRAAGLDMGKLLFHALYRPVDGRFKSQIRLEGFGARASIAGDLTYAGGTLSVANRLVLSEERGVFLDMTLKSGTLRGRAPVQDYFILGIDNETTLPLRGHAAAADGAYGKSPIGTDFVLMNSDIERRIAALPILDGAIRGELFADVAKVFDRNRVYAQAGWFVDVGAGVKIQLQDMELVMLYGRSLSDGKGILKGYIQHRFW